MMDMKPYKLPKMSSDEVSELLDRERICRIAFKGAEFPYLAPFQYVRMGGALYFHFTDYGRKMRLLENDRRVCVGIESLEPDMSEYRFVVLRGELERVVGLLKWVGVGFLKTFSPPMDFLQRMDGRPFRRISRWSSSNLRGSATQ
jgi:nitroimidazol reductase NimA-like FMN-containing flavoprotein (pyridoxamine 5'-phosphate oxidase superfamily)